MLETLLTTLAPLAAIFGWAFFSFWSAIPAGLALGVAPVPVVLTVTASYASGAALVLLVGAPLRQRIRRQLDASTAPQSTNTADPSEKPPAKRMVGLVRRAWARYGLLGLGLLAPMTVGSQVATVLGLSLGVRAWPLLLALTLGALAWAIPLTLAFGLGLLTLDAAL